jgi:hypothetical protein
MGRQNDYPFSCNENGCNEGICKHPEHFPNPQERIVHLAKEGICKNVECPQRPCTHGTHDHPRFECDTSESADSAEQKYKRVTMFVTSCFDACRTMGFKLHLFQPSYLNSLCLVCKMDQGKGKLIGMEVVGGVDRHFSYACADCLHLLCSELTDLECI